ncbi:hypothetical protein BUE80_DR011730, partial [Diplocarpon rosae]
GTRTLDSAVNELRWLREYVNTLIPRPRGSQPQKSNAQPRPHQPHDSAQQARDRQKILVRLCQRRARSEPLQYLLGSQPFGTLDIRCRKGVLIPRPETEAYTAHVAKLLLGKRLHPALMKPLGRTKKTPLRILDLCSGSGCIALLLHCLLKSRKPYLAILGLDISPNAISLARQNLRHNMRLRLLSRAARKHVEFRRGDIFSPSLLSGKLWGSGVADAMQEKAAEDGVERGEETAEERGEERGEEEREQEVDLIISNPPYISQRAFDTETTRSVRNWEPRLALLPSAASIRTGDDQDAGNGEEKVPKRIGSVDLEDEDLFFVRLMAIHDLRNSKVCVMEVGDEEQAERVVAFVFSFLFRRPLSPLLRTLLGSRTNPYPISTMLLQSKQTDIYPAKPL